MKYRNNQISRKCKELKNRYFFLNRAKLEEISAIKVYLFNIYVENQQHQCLNPVKNRISSLPN